MVMSGFNMTIWIIMWSYHDGSESGVIDRAFTNEEEARWFANTLVEQAYGSGKAFNLISVEVK